MSTSSEQGHSARAVANSILSLAEVMGIHDLTPMKLQKLIYYCHAWHLALKGEPLIKEAIEAWNYGPVISDIYQAFKRFGANPIPNSGFASDVERVDGRFQEIVPFVENPGTLAFISSVLSRYGQIKPFQLSNMTHRDGEPWKVMHDQFPGSLPSSTEIPNDLIKQCFENFASAKSK